MVPLSEEEQRLLEQMEEALAAEDPKFVSALRGSSTRSRHKRLTLLGCLAFVAGIATLMTGAVLALTPLAVLGFVVMLGGAYLALTHFRQIGEPDATGDAPPTTKAKGRAAAPRQSGFMNRMEDRWRRRRDDY
jgi:threonine/homoserine/homoserine lactone efflux protein